MKYERKHRISKQTAHVSLSRVNITKTLATKHQLQMNYRFLDGFKNDTDIICGPTTPYNCVDEKFDCVYDQRDIFSVQWITTKGFEIEVGSVIMENGEDGPQFSVVDKIFSNEKLGFFSFFYKN